jgi:hypothetical protein
VSNELSAPRWLRDLERFLPLKSQFILTGNIRDLAVRSVGGSLTAVPLKSLLAASLFEAGYSAILDYDPVTGFAVASAPSGVDGDSAILGRLGLTAAGPSVPAGPELFSATLERFVGLEGAPVALIADLASRLVVRADSLTGPEHLLFTLALALTQSARARPVGEKGTPLFNTIVWLADKEGDLPDWLSIDNPRIRHIPVPVPDRSARRAIAPSLVRSLPGARGASDEAMEAAENELVDSTEGLLLMDLSAITQLARSEGVEIGEVGDAVRRYKVGVTDDQWRKIERRTIAEGEETIGRRVVGQDHAVTHLLDIVKRAATGVGGGSRSRPRGVAFLAGPTGVGKTELAKAVTELLFGDESAYIRFDMSEFSSEHADQRLIGAPPGYVGYDVGGELTNAIREKPFSVVLFDEIEKAHPRILDKFLQVLDDGVLTSGRGDRVYFSESLIVFTSNLGIYTEGPTGARIANVTSEEPYGEVRDRVRAAIEAHFKLVLNRPEILNRFGENIIVFDFIRPEVAAKIFDAMVNHILRDVSGAGYSVTIKPECKEALRGLCTADLSNGGRGIRNKLEAHLVNPLARALFDSETTGQLVIVSIENDGPTTQLVLEQAA